MRTLWKKVLFAPILLFALATYGFAVTVTPSATPQFNGGSGAYANPTIVVKPGSMVGYRLTATVTGSANVSDNWGCTEAKLGSAIGFIDHANWRSGSRSISSADGGIGGAYLKATADAGTYPITFSFYSGSVNSVTGRCTGSKIGSDYIVDNAVRVEGDADVDIASQQKVGGDMKAIGNTPYKPSSQSSSTGATISTTSQTPSLPIVAPLYRPSSQSSSTGEIISTTLQTLSSFINIVPMANTAVSRDVNVALRSTREIQGDIVAIGNTSICVPETDLGRGRALSSGNWVKVYDTLSNGRYDYQRLLGNQTPKCLNPQSSRYMGRGDNSLYAYVNDSGVLVASIDESNTKAKLTLPANSKIVEATLYWMGMFPNKIRVKGEWPVDSTTCAATNDGPFNGGPSYGNSINNCSAKNTLNQFVDSFSKVELKVPSKGYVGVTAEKAYISTDWNDGNEHYLMKADVTSLIDPDPSAQNGDYFVKGVQTRLHTSMNVTFGAWALVVIYENPDDTPKHIAVFDGSQYVTSSHQFALSGFETPRLGNVNGSFIYMAGWGGIKELTGDDCLIFNYSGNPVCSDVPAANPAGGKAIFLGGKNNDANPFRSSVSVDGVPTPANGSTTSSAWGVNPAGSLPASSYTLNFNLHRYKFNNVLKNAQTSTNVKVITDSDNDGYGDFTRLQFFAFSTMIHTPYLGDITQEATLSACANSRTLGGTSAHYTLTFRNTGNIYAHAVKLIDDFGAQGILGLINHSKTTVPTLKLNGVVQPNACKVTATGIECGGDTFHVGIGETVTVDFDIAIAANISASDFNKPGGFVNVANATYENPDYTPPKKVVQPATVSAPKFISQDSCNVHSCVDPKLSITVKKFSAGDGLYIIKPFQSVYTEYANANVKDPFDEPMMIYCSGIDKYTKSASANADRNASLIETWIPLPMSLKTSDTLITSNFYFNSILRDYVHRTQVVPDNRRLQYPFYTSGAKRDTFPVIQLGKVKKANDYVWSASGDPISPIYGLRINLSDLTLHESMYDWEEETPTGTPQRCCSGVRCNMSCYTYVELAKVHHTDSFPFTNINLIGTGFAIDKSKSSWQCASGLEDVLGHYDQIVKVDGALDNSNYVDYALTTQGEYYTTFATKTAANCRASKLTFKQLNGGGDFVYRYAEPQGERGGVKSDGSRELYFSCRDIQQYGPNKGKYKNGFYLIDPLDNQGVPFVAYCHMPTVAAGVVKAEETITTSLLALGGNRVAVASSIGNDSCSRLGLSFFVPTNENIFKNMQARLKAQQSQWSAYVGTNGNWTVGTSAKSSYYISDLNNNPAWPYGPFGLFRNSGSSGAWAYLHSKDFETQNRNTLDKYGWKTIYDETATNVSNTRQMLEKMKNKENTLKNVNLDKTFWISDGNCGWGGYGEPNGNYYGNAWLNFVFDNDGNVIHCDDAGAAYIYYNYSCVGLDSFNAVAATNELPNAALGWDSTLNPSKDPPALFTKMASDTAHPVKIKIAPDPKGDVKSFTGSICAKLVVKNDAFNPLVSSTNPAAWTQTPTSAAQVDPLVSGATSAAIDGYYCYDVDETTSGDLVANPVIFTWNAIPYASKEAYVDVKFYDHKSSEITSSCKASDITAGTCKVNQFETSKFSVRPTFNPNKGSYNGKWTAEEQYGSAAYPANSPNNPTPYPIVQFKGANAISVAATQGYKAATTRSDPKRSGGCPDNDALCVKAIDNKVGIGDVSAYIDANLSFSGLITPTSNALNVHWIRYDNVGDLNLSLLDKSWTTIDQNRYPNPADQDKLKNDYALSDVSKWLDDCIPDSAATSPNNTLSSIHYGKIGCDVYWDVGKAQVKPSEFNISSFRVEGAFKGTYGDSEATFVYYANDDEAIGDEQFAMVIIDAQAMGKIGSTPLSYYSDGNYSKDLNHSFGLFASDYNSSIHNAWTCYYQSGAPDSCDIVDPTTPASVWKDGEASLTYALNFERDFKTPLGALFMEANGNDLNLSLKDTDDTYGSAKWDKDAIDVGNFEKIDFIYGRAHLGDVITKGEDANVSYRIDYFSDRASDNGVRGVFKSPSALASSAGWYNIPRVNSANAVVDGATEAVITARFEANKATSRLKNGEWQTLPYSAANARPRRFVSHLIDFPTYLWYHPFGKPYSYDPLNIENRKECFSHPCGTIEFLIPDTDGWGGHGSGVVGRHYDDNSTRDRTPIRLGR